MSKNILIISTSLRKGSNSEMLADEFMRGAKEAGHQAEKISLRDKRVGFCKGCLTCQKTGCCVIQDDAIAIAEKMRTADVIAFATPIYYYEMSGQMKTLLDRANSLFSSKYEFQDIYLLTAAAENEETAADGAINGLQGWIDCFEKAHLSGTVFAGGVDAAGEAEGHASLRKAFELGRNI